MTNLVVDASFLFFFCGTDVCLCLFCLLPAKATPQQLNGDNTVQKTPLLGRLLKLSPSVTFYFKATTTIKFTAGQSAI